MKQTTKKLLSLNLAILMVVLLLPITAQATNFLTLYGGTVGKTATGSTEYALPVGDYSSVYLPGEIFENSTSTQDIFVGYSTAKSVRNILNMNKDRNAPIYIEDHTYTLAPDTVLYALWDKYRVVCHGNGGLTAKGADSLIYLSGLAVERYYGFNVYNAINQFMRPGYVLTGWNTEPDGTGEWRLSAETGERLELYAQWEVQKGVNYIRYIHNNRISYEYLNQVPATVHIRELGTESENNWYWSSVTVKGAGYIPGVDAIVNDSNMTLVARELAESAIIEGYISVACFGNGGALDNGENVVYGSTSGGSLTVYSPFKLDGYDLVSWNTKPDGSGTEYPGGEKVSSIKGQKLTILYAQWVYDPMKEKTIFFDPIVRSENTVLLAALYDEDGRMFKVVNAEFKGGYPQATVLNQDYVRMKRAVLFNMDGRTNSPVDTVQTIIRE